MYHVGDMFVYHIGDMFVYHVGDMFVYHVGDMFVYHVGDMFVYHVGDHGCPHLIVCIAESIAKFIKGKEFQIAFEENLRFLQYCSR